eukprot:g9008.t1
MLPSLSAGIRVLALSRSARSDGAFGSNSDPVPPAKRPLRGSFRDSDPLLGLDSSEEYFSNASDVNRSDLTACSELGAFDQYLALTGDADGVVYASGSSTLRCVNGVWWLAPACRLAPSECIPLLLRAEWKMLAVMVSAAKHSMPVRIGHVEKVFLPGAIATSYASIAVTAALEVKAPRVHEFMKRMSFSEADVRNLSLAKMSAREAACCWLQANSHWRDWIPMKPLCRSGTVAHPLGYCRARPTRGREDSPGEVFQCFDDVLPKLRCPGGAPGRCAVGRDPKSLACSACIAGYRSHQEGCISCESHGAWSHVVVLLYLALHVSLIGVVHFLFVKANSRRSTSTSLLHAEIGHPSGTQFASARTIGTIFVVFFIAMMSWLLVPFRCQTHPTGFRTLQAYPEIACNWEDEHLQMVLISGSGSLIPLSFLAICFWLMCHYPSRLQNGDTKFTRSCAFLSLRLRPGEELISLFLLGRNVLLVLCPVLPSGRRAGMSLLLTVSLVVTVLRLPWRAKGSNFIDVLMHFCALFILDFYGEAQSNDPLPVTVAVMLVLAAFFVTIIYGFARYFLKVFLGSEQLTDLTKPLCYVAYEVENLILLGTAQVLTQRWCVAELVIARLQKINSVLIPLPDFRMPDATFITNYMTSVPDISDLASYGITTHEIKDTILWVCKLPCLPLGTLEPASLNLVLGVLEPDQNGTELHLNESARVAILADPENLGATATAYVLLGLLEPHLNAFGLGSCTVLRPGQSPSRGVASMLFLCSETCWASEQIVQWLCKACEMPECFLLPVLIGDHFQFPNAEVFSRLLDQQELTDPEFYETFIETVFLEAAGTFTPTLAAGLDLELQAARLCHRIQSRLRPRIVRQNSALDNAGDLLKAQFKRQGSVLQRLASFLMPNKREAESNGLHASSSAGSFSSGMFGSEEARPSRPDPDEETTSVSF